MNRNWYNQKANPALNTKAGNNSRKGYNSLKKEYGSTQLFVFNEESKTPALSPRLCFFIVQSVQKETQRF